MMLDIWLSISKLLQNAIFYFNDVDWGINIDHYTRRTLLQINYTYPDHSLSSSLKSTVSVILGHQGTFCAQVSGVESEYKSFEQRE